MRWSVLVLLLLCLSAPAAWAQRVVRTDSLLVHRDTLYLDRAPPYRLRPFVRPGTLTLRAGHTTLDTTTYRVDWVEGRVWLTSIPPPASYLIATYQTWPIGLQPIYRQRGIVAENADSAGVLRVVEEETRGAPVFDPFGDTRLARSGSLTRGILAGSNRDVSIESGLRLQLEGEVLAGVNLRAVLTDENTPILAEGTTQRLSEFDRVYIEVTGQQAEARLGDVDVSLRATELAQLTRKVQGASALARVGGRGGLWQGGQVQAVGSSPRGQFRVQEIRPIEGVQGPYRLEGGAGEPYVLVVPGSEIVYLDGQRLVRDRNADYTIDYATGEITFTPRRLLTAEQRVTVEFQYTTNQYPRTLVAAEAEAGVGGMVAGQPRFTFGAAFIREADRRTLSVDLDLTDADSLLLRQSGDAPAFRSGAVRVPFDPEAPYVQYAVEPRGADSVFVPLAAAPDAATPVYRVRFSRVAAGTGRYARGARTLNGIAYEFVGAGGDYEPVRLLPKPREQQLLGLSGKLQAVAGVEVYGEWGASLNDLNRFSSLDAADDAGQAYTAGARLSPVATPIGRVEAHYARHFRARTFVSFDRLRPVDFARTWNLTDAFGSAATSPDAAVRELTDEGGVRLLVTPLSLVGLTLGRLERGPAFRAERAALQAETAEPGGPVVRYAGALARSDDAAAGVRGSWLRQQALLEQPLLEGRFRPRVEVEHERRAQHYGSVAGADSVGRGSLAFVDVRPGVAWRDEALEASLSYGLRREEEPLDGALQYAALARTLSGTLRYQPGAAFQVQSSVGLRRKRYADAFVGQEGRQDGETVALQLDLRWAPLRRAFDFNVGYEAQTQRAPRLQEIYVRVGPELAEAQYVWQDLNGNGLLDLDEFIPETTPFEGIYAKTFVPSDTLVGVIGVQARVRLGFDPARLWSGPAQPWQRLLSRLSTRTTLDVNERNSGPDLTRLYLLDLSRFLDPVFTQNGRIRVGQEVFLFRGETRYGLDLSGSLLRSRNQLAGETESRRVETYRAEGRYRPVARLGLRGGATRERDRAESARYASRRFQITSSAFEVGATWTPLPGFQAGASAHYARKRDRTAGRTATVERLPLDARLSRAGRYVLSATAEAARVRLEGDARGQAAYELTEGRGPGTSFLWNVTFQYVLTRYLNLSLAYDGRAPAAAPAIHTARMQVSATF